MDPMLVYAAVTMWLTLFVLMTLIWLHSDVRKLLKAVEAELKR